MIAYVNMKIVRITAIEPILVTVLAMVLKKKFNYGQLLASLKILSARNTRNTIIGELRCPDSYINIANSILENTIITMSKRLLESRT